MAIPRHPRPDWQNGEVMEKAMHDVMRDERERQLASVSRCQMCGRSYTGAEWDLLRHAQAMNFVLRNVRLIVEAEGGKGSVSSARILEALNEPYRFPLPDGPSPQKPSTF